MYMCVARRCWSCWMGVAAAGRLCPSSITVKAAGKFLNSTLRIPRCFQINFPFSTTESSGARFINKNKENNRNPLSPASCSNWGSYTTKVCAGPQPGPAECRGWCPQRKLHLRTWARLSSEMLRWLLIGHLGLPGWSCCCLESFTHWREGGRCYSSETEWGNEFCVWCTMI